VFIQFVYTTVYRYDGFLSEKFVGSWGYVNPFGSSQLLEKEKNRRKKVDERSADANLGFAFFFFAVVLGPLELTWVAFEAQRAFLAFSRAEPENRAVVFDVHHACARWEIGSAE
jgi:hypothetical protein